MSGSDTRMPLVGGRRAAARRIAIVYFLAAAAWILLSDFALLALSLDVDDVAGGSIAKGLLFCIVSALALYLAIARYADPPLDELRAPASAGRAHPLSKAGPSALFAGAALLVIALAAGMFELDARHERAEARAGLAAILELKANLIEQWLEQRRQVAISFGGARSLREQYALLARDAGPAVVEDMKSRLESIRAGLGIDAVLLFDQHGALAAGAGQDIFLRASPSLAEQAKRAIAGGQTVFQVLHREERAGRAQVLIDFIVPLRAPAAGGVDGLLVLRGDATKHLFRIVQKWPTPSASAESLLVRRADDEVLYLNDLRFRADSAMNFRRPLSEGSLPAAVFLRNKDATAAEGVDYRGVKVFAVARPIAGTDWTLIAKIDAAEVLERLSRSGKVWIASILGIILLASLGVSALWRERMRLVNLHERADAAERDLLVKHLDLLSRHANDIVLLVDDQGCVVDANERAVEKYGLPREALIGTHIRALRAPAEKSDLDARLAHIWRTGSALYESQQVDRDGKAFPVEISARAVEVDGRRYLQAIIRDISERRKAESDIRASEADLRSLFDNMLNGMARCEMVYDGAQPVDFVYRDVNRAFESLTGLKDVVGRRVTEIIPGIAQKDPALFAFFGRVATTGKPESSEIFLASLQQWFHISAYSPGAGTFVAVFDVVTARKEAEAKLRRTRLRLELATSGTGLAVWDWPDTRDPASFWLSRGVFELLGYRQGEFASNLDTFLAMVDPADRDALLAAIGRAVESGEPQSVEYRARTKQGALRWYLSRGRRAPVSGSGGPRLVGTFEDITVRKSAEVALRESEERLRVLLEQSIAAVYVIQDGRIVYVNARMREIFGYAPDEPFNADPLAHVAAEERAKVAEQMALRMGAESTGAYSIVSLRKDGTPFLLGLHAKQVLYGGRPGIIAIAQDITEKARAEEEIARHLASLQRAVQGTIQVVSTIGELRDPYTHGHERRVGEIATAIASEMGLPANQLEGVRVAGYLHDVGKIGVPAEILSKPSKLSKAEFDLVKQHAQQSYDILKGVDFPWPVAEAAWQHHERMDGTGYPRGLKGEAIILEARILAVADTVEAMASHRPYRPGLGIDKALAEIERGSGTAYDPAVAAACLRLFREKRYEISK